MTLPIKSDLRGIYLKEEKTTDNSDYMYYGVANWELPSGADYNLTMVDLPLPEAKDAIDVLFEHTPPIIKLLDFFNKILITITDWNCNKITDLQVSFMRKKIMKDKKKAKDYQIPFYRRKKFGFSNYHYYKKVLRRKK